MAALIYERTEIKQLYLKPLIPKGLERYIKPEHALRILQRDLLKRFRAAFRLQDAFSERARIALARSLKAKIQKSSLIITTNHPAFRPLVLGMAKRQMTWLTKAKSPIPIITESGELIFRAATPKTMADGKWIHPGHPPTDIIDKVRKDTRKYVKERLTEEIQRQIRQAMRRAA